MGLLDAFKQYVRDAAPGGLLNPEWTPERVRQAGEVASMTPTPLGDVAAGLLAVDDLRRGNYGDAALNAVGLLPFVPAIGGMGVIKEFGKMPKRGLLPSGVSTDMVPVGIPERMFGDAMDANIKQMTTGDYLGRYAPSWGGEGKAFYAIGDDIDELQSFMAARMDRSQKGTAGAKAAKAAKTPLGALKAEFGDVFDIAKSTQSNSKYFVHRPTGTKIRVSDHDLPLHYEQPDIDLRSWQSPEDWISAVRKALE